MCTYDSCPTATESYESRREWVDHHCSHISSGEGEPTTATCPFCLEEFAIAEKIFYSHVGHHMEDIRLFSLPLSYRQPDDSDDDSQGLDDSSNTEPSDKVQLRSRGGALSRVEEEIPHTAAPGVNNLSEYIKMCNLADSNIAVTSWLSGEKVVTPVLKSAEAKSTAEHDFKSIQGYSLRKI